MGEVYDTLIIGAGSAGMPAGIYAARYGLKTHIISKDIGGLLATTSDVENYPGYVKVKGPELMKKFEEQVRGLGVDISTEELKSLEKKDGVFSITTDKGEHQAKTVILTMGLPRKRLPAKGDEEYYGKGISYCATCDGAFSKDRVVGVVGGGDSAVHGASIVAQFAKKVYLFVRREELRAEPINAQHIKNNPKIEIRWKTQVDEVYGEGMMKGVKLSTGEDLPLDMLFVEIGSQSPVELLKSFGLDPDAQGMIPIDHGARTNVPGLFVAGDLSNVPLKQTITAAAYGSSAALSAYEYLKEKGL